MIALYALFFSSLIFLFASAGVGAYLYYFCQIQSNVNYDIILAAIVISALFSIYCGACIQMKELEEDQE